jgi:hypothetical protein
MAIHGSNRLGRLARVSWLFTIAAIEVCLYWAQ